MTKNKTIGLILFVISVIFLIATASLPTSKYGSSVGANIFPYIASSGLLLCSVALFFRRETEKDKQPFLDKAGWLRILMITVILVLFPIMLTYLGFIVASLFMLFMLTLLFDLEKKTKKWFAAVVSILTTGVLYVLFQFVLNTRLPVGELFKALGR